LVAYEVLCRQGIEIIFQTKIKFPNDPLEKNVASQMLEKVT